MRYWFTINSALSENEARKVWALVSPFKANLTVLFDRAHVYGNGDDSVVSAISSRLSETGFPVGRG